MPVSVKSSSGGAAGRKGAPPTAKQAKVGALVAVIVIALALAGFFGVRVIGGLWHEHEAATGGPSQTLLDRANAMLPKQYTPYGKPPRPGEIRPPMGTFGFAPMAGQKAVPAGQQMNSSNQ